MDEWRAFGRVEDGVIEPAEHVRVHIAHLAQRVIGDQRTAAVRQDLVQQIAAAQGGHRNVMGAACLTDQIAANDGRAGTRHLMHANQNGWQFGAEHLVSGVEPFAQVLRRAATTLHRSKAQICLHREIRDIRIDGCAQLDRLEYQMQGIGMPGVGMPGVDQHPDVGMRNQFVQCSIDMRRLPA